MLPTPAALLFWSFAITLSISLAVIGASNILFCTFIDFKATFD
jgi:hypothetical protein